MPAPGARSAERRGLDGERMTFNGLALVSHSIQVRDAATGRLIAQLNLPQANWSGIATVGDALVFGLGTDYSASNAGIEVATPGGKPPIVPRSQ